MGSRALTGPVTEYIAGELRAQKARHAWSLNALAERTGLPRNTIDRCLKNDIAIAVETFVQLCRGMDLDAPALLREAMEYARRSHLDAVPMAARHEDRDAGPDGGGL